MSHDHEHAHTHDHEGEDGHEGSGEKGHGHGHGHDHHGHGDAPARALGAALVLTASVMVVEVVVGFWSGSLALLADAGHMLNDAAALGLSLLVTWVAARPRTVRHTFGLRRAEVVGAFVNAVSLGVAGILVIHEAVQRFGAAPEIRGVGMLVAATLGLVANLASAWILSRHGGSSMNVRGALMHVLSDVLGSIAAIVAGGLVLGLGWRLADPIASLLIAVLILFGALRLLRDTAHVLMEGAPEGLDVAAIERTIQQTEGVLEVHDLHVWSIVPGEPLVTAHVVLRPGAHGTGVARLVGVQLEHAHGVHHATIQPESPEAPLVSLTKKPAKP